MIIVFMFLSFTCITEIGQLLLPPFDFNFLFSIFYLKIITTSKFNATFIVFDDSNFVFVKHSRDITLSFQNDVMMKTRKIREISIARKQRLGNSPVSGANQQKELLIIIIHICILMILYRCGFFFFKAFL